MTQGTERLSIYGAVNLLERHEFEPPTRFEGDTRKWFSEEVQAGRLVFHDRTGRKIEPGERRGLLLGLSGETTSIERLNAWLERIDHLRRIPETACVPTAAVILERHDENSRPVFRVPLCPSEVPAELLTLPADTPVVYIDEHGSLHGVGCTSAAMLADYIRGRLPAGAPADAPEPASAPAVAVAAPTPAPSASAPTVAAPEPAQKQKKPRRSWWNEVVSYLAGLLRDGKHRTAKELHRAAEKLAGADGSPFEIVDRELRAREFGRAVAVKTLQNRWAEVKAAAGMQ